MYRVYKIWKLLAYARSEVAYFWNYRHGRAESIKPVAPVQNVNFSRETAMGKIMVLLRHPGVRLPNNSEEIFLKNGSWKIEYLIKFTCISYVLPCRTSSSIIPVLGSSNSMLTKRYERATYSRTGGNRRGWNHHRVRQHPPPQDPYFIQTFFHLVRGSRRVVHERENAMYTRTLKSAVASLPARDHIFVLTDEMPGEGREEREAEK